MKLFNIDWIYYSFDEKTGMLIDEDGYFMADFGKFPDSASAEAWLVENDIRGSVR